MTKLQVILLLTGHQDVAQNWIEHSLDRLFAMVEQAEKQAIKGFAISE